MEERSFSPVVQQSLSGCCVTPLKRIITPLSYMKKTVDPWCWFHVAVTETISNFTLFFPFKWNPNRREIEPTLIAVMQKQLFIVREPFSLHANCTCSLFSLQPGSESGVGIISSPEQAESTGSFSASELKQGQCLWFQQRPAVHFTDIPKVSVLFRESQPGLWWRTHQDAPSRMSQTGSQLHKFMSLKSYLCLSFELQRN